MQRKAGLFLIGLIFIIYAFKRKETWPTPYVFPKLPGFPEMPSSATNPVTEEGVRLGRFLFYDPILSKDKNLACAGCHKQEAAFSDAPRAFSDGRQKEKMRRNTPPLFNLAWYPAFFWDGRAASIEEQVLFPVKAHNEMNLDWKKAAKRVRKSLFYVPRFRQAFGNQAIDSILISKAIGQFLRTLLSYRSKFDMVFIGKAKYTRDEYDGYVMVNNMIKGDCLHCHTTDGDALGTTLTYSNNGLDKMKSAVEYKDKGRGAFTGKPTEMGTFKIPSIRNLGFTAPYMHDGRFKTMEEVVDFYSEGVNICANIDSKMEYAYQGGVRLAPEEKHKILAFLKTLNDTAFIKDTAFSNPFLKR